MTGRGGPAAVCPGGPPSYPRALLLKVFLPDVSKLCPLGTAARVQLCVSGLSRGALGRSGPRGSLLRRSGCGGRLPPGTRPSRCGVPRALAAWAPSHAFPFSIELASSRGRPEDGAGCWLEGRRGRRPAQARLWQGISPSIPRGGTGPVTALLTLNLREAAS